MAQAGWYPDPAGNTQLLRYWNGTAWTEQVTSAQGGQLAQQPAQVQQPASQQNDSVQAYGNGAQPTVVVINQQPAQSQSSDNALLAAFILCIVSTVSWGLFLFPLAWCIPMTVHCYHIYKGEKPNTTAFGVCTLLFVNMISGILLLCQPKSEA